jgi:purine nucleoside permease
MFKNIIITILVIVVGFLTYINNYSKEEKQTVQQKETQELSVVLTAYSGLDENDNMSGETAPFYSALKNRQDVSDFLPFCEAAYQGNIFSSEVLLVTTGIGKTASSNCVLSILQEYESDVKEVVFVGTAGISPKSENGLNKTVVGDVCVNSAAYDFDSQTYSYDNETPFWKMNENINYFSSESGDNLVKEIISASNYLEFSEMPDIFSDYIVLYSNEVRQPKVWSPSECVEASGDFYWHDSLFDKRAREIGSYILNKKYSGQVDSDSVIIVTAPESYPVGKVLEGWNKSQNTNIPYVYVRSASNYDQVYLNESGNPGISASENLNSEENRTGSLYAIEVASTLVLKMFEIRNYSN